MDMLQLREKIGLRREDVASRLGIAESTVRNWESGRTIPRLRADEILRLCTLYECSLEELVQAAQESHSKFKEA
jgi:transcriptional regulator with XRE-family HTH domain